MEAHRQAPPGTSDPGPGILVEQVRTRPLAEQIVYDYLAPAHAEPRPDRTVYDHLLLAAHRRIGTDPPRWSASPTRPRKRPKRTTREHHT